MTASGKDGASGAMRALWERAWPLAGLTLLILVAFALVVGCGCASRGLEIFTVSGREASLLFVARGDETDRLKPLEGSRSSVVAFLWWSQ